MSWLLRVNYASLRTSGWLFPPITNYIRHLLIDPSLKVEIQVVLSLSIAILFTGLNIDGNDLAPK